MKQNTVKADLSDLDEFLNALGKEYAVKVGLVGSKGGETHTDEDGENTDMDNASIGLIQEFGSIKNNIPPRSFLRMPIEEKQRDIVEEMQEYLDKDGNEKAVGKEFYERLGAAAVKAIDDAFSTGGFGKWVANKPETVAQKDSSAPLIDTGQLRRAVDYEVVRNKEA